MITNIQQLLGRATKIGDYVKRNCREAFVEITLHRESPQRDMVIRRDISISSGSKWYIDGKHTTNERAKEVIESLNIQLNNLTQFLPQDKVTEFASLGPIDLLKQTENAVLPKHIVETHQKLIEAQKQFRGVNTTVDELRQQIDVLKKKNELLERDVEKIREKEKLSREMEDYQMALPFIQFNKEQENGKRLRDEIEAKKRELEAVNTKIQPFEVQLSALNEKKRAVMEKKKTAEQEASKLEREFGRVTKCMTDLQDKENEEKAVFDQTKFAMQTQERKKAELDKQIDELRRKIQSMVQPEQIAQEIEGLNPEIDKLMKEIDSYYEQKTKRNSDIQNCEHAIAKLRERNQRLDNIRHQRMELLQRLKCNHELQAYQWLQRNRNLLKGEVYFIPLEISLKNDLHAKYLENYCQRSLMLTFVCERREDQELMVQELSRKKQLNLNISYASQSSQDVPDRIHDIEQVRKYGITHYLDETFDAPPIVKQIMNSHAQLYKVACGTATTEQTWQRMFEDPEIRIRIAFSPEARYGVKHSKYDTSVRSTSVIPLKPTKLFQAADLSEKSQNEKHILDKIQEMNRWKESIKELNNAIQHAQTNLEQINQKKSTLSRQREAFHRLHELEKKLAHRKQTDRPMNFEAAKQRMKVEMKKIAIERVSCALQLAYLTKKATDISLEKDRYPLEQIAIQFQIDEVANKFEGVKTEQNALQAELGTLQSKFAAIQNELKTLKKEWIEAKQRYQEKYPDVDNDELIAIMNGFPQDLEVAKTKIFELQQRMNAIHDDPSVTEQYEKRRVEIEQKEEALKRHQHALDNHDNLINSYKTTWLNALRPCVETINEAFVQNCKNIGISGEVSLSEDEVDYDKWAIQIKVKFRDNEQLALLNANRQSGGERSVTTMLYLLSLQALNKCPFRVVDEINQGMDPENERKIFYLMLDSSKGSDISQSFLITPKLLPDLVPNHANNITVLFIYNGVHNIKQEEWDQYAKEIKAGIE